jgi:hypothetical protein
VDTTAPTWSASSSVKTSNITINSITLGWDKASDNVGVTDYKIYKNNALITTVDGNTTSYNVTGLDQNTEYSFKVEAVDAAKNANAATIISGKTLEKVITGDNSGVTVKGNIPSAVSKLGVNTVGVTSDIDESLNKIASPTEKYKTVLAYDLSLLDDKDSKVELSGNGSATVSIKLPENLLNKTLAVFYIDDKGAATKIDSSVANGAITFTTTHFSRYVVAEVDKVTPAGNSNSGSNSTGTNAGSNSTGNSTSTGTNSASNNAGSTAGTAAGTTSNTAGNTTGTTTGTNSAANDTGIVSGTGTSVGNTTNSTGSTSDNVANPKTGNFEKSKLGILMAGIIAFAAMIAVVIRRRRVI